MRDIAFPTSFHHLAVIVLCFSYPASALANSAETSDLGSAHKKKLFSLPQQELSKTLITIEKLGGIPLQMKTKLRSGLISPTVHASDEREALRQALAGSGYVSLANGDHFVISEDTEVAGQERITVTAKRDMAEKQYNVDATASSTRTGGDLRALPQSTRTVTSALMADQQIQTVADAMRNVSGMTVNRGNLQGGNTYTVRGWSTTGLTNGMVDPTGGMQPVANVERVEVLKGPAALLAGSGNMGGSVNIVTKKPVAERILDISGDYASYDDRKITVDADTALNHAKTLSFRVIGDFADQTRSWAGYKGRKEYSIAPSLRFKNGTVDVTVGVENSKQRQPQTGYALMTSPDSSPQVLTPGHAFGPDNQGITNWNTRWYYETTWNIAHWLTFVSRSHASRNTLLINMFGPGSNLGNNRFLFLKTTDRQETNQYATDDYLRAKFHTSFVKHTISVGLNYSDFSLSDYGIDPRAGSSMFIIDLDHSRSLTAFQPTNTYEYRLGAKQLGFYGQDLLEYDRFHLFASIRHSSYNSSGGSAKSTTIGKISPMAGLVIDINRQISIYGSFNRGFTPNFSLGTDNKLLPSQISTNFEAGLKGLFFHKKLDATVSVYRLDQSNYPILSPGAVNRYTVLPGLRTQGLDIDVSGQILTGWSVSGSFSYAGFRYLSTQLGNFLVPAQPKIKYSLFTTYVFNDGILKNAGASFGVYGFSSSNLTSYYPRYTLAGQHEIDLNFFYSYNKIKWNLGITNIENNNNYGVGSVPVYIPTSGPRMFRGTISYSFF